VTFPQRMEHRTTKKILSLVFSFIFALFSLSFFKREEEDGKAMTDCVRGRKGAQGKLFVELHLGGWSRLSRPKRKRGRLTKSLIKSLCGLQITR
jgi:hypothetical protein